MFQALLVKILIKMGSELLLSVAKASVETLHARKDNDLDIGAETIKTVLEYVKVEKK